MEDREDQIVKLVDHLFRHEAGKMVSVLTRVFGFRNIDQAEDIVQDTLVRALEVWKYGKIPQNPEGWLYQAAKNHAIDLIRRQKLRHKIESDIAYLLKSEYTLTQTMNEMFAENEIKDSQLRMMFACCHPAVPSENQITLILKTLCGLSTKEIAKAFISTEETIQKRLYRTKEKIREEHVSLEYPAGKALKERTAAVLKALYLLFNEGYCSSHPEKLIREDLCEEAMRLVILLTENKETDLPETNALLALMCYQASRFGARLNDKGFIVLLKDQDRSQWNRFLIHRGNDYLSRSATGETMHEFHIEAGIAFQHANASSFQDTNWKVILSLYDDLFRRTNNPIVAMNRLLVLAEVDGCIPAIAGLEKLKGLSENCYYHTALAEMNLRAGKKQEARKYFSTALVLTSSVAEIELIRAKILACS
jgi:RNA polymerase sigma factor (sigma-70 family)